MTTSLLYLFSGAPHGSINAQEGLDALLMGSAFTECRALFLGEGVLQLLKEQETDGIGTRNFAMGFKALPDYGVTQIGVCASAMAHHHLVAEDLLVDAELLETASVRQWLAAADRILNFS